MLRAFKQHLADIRNYVKAYAFVNYSANSLNHSSIKCDTLLALNFKEVLNSGINNSKMYKKLFNLITEKSKVLSIETNLFFNDFLLVYNRCIITEPSSGDKELIEFLYNSSIECVAKICDYHGLNKKDVLAHIGATLVLSILRIFFELNRDDERLRHPNIDNEFFLSKDKKSFSPQSLIQSIMPALEKYDVSYQEVNRKIDSFKLKVSKDTLDSINTLNVSYLTVFSTEASFSQTFNQAASLNALQGLLCDTAAFLKEKKSLTALLVAIPGVSSAPKKNKI